MTTPAHCTRTWYIVGRCPANDDGKHHCELSWRTDHDPHVCGCGNVLGVEPPADVAATPDPRLDVVARFIRESWVGEDDNVDFKGARRILDALDDLAAAQTMHEPNVMKIQVIHDCPTRWWDKTEACRVYLDGWHRCNGHEPYGDHVCDCRSVAPSLLVPNGPGTPAPAGLTPAQEIRLRLAEMYDETDGDGPASIGEVVTKVLGPLAAWVEHGDDETSGPACTHDLQRWANDLRRLTAAEARADLAEARLGHIADALRDWAPKSDFGNAVRDGLVWTPDDTATAGADTTGDGYAAGGPVSAGASVIVGEGERFWVRDDDGTMREVHEAKEAPDGGE